MDKERHRNTSLLSSPEAWRPVSSCCALDMVLGAMDLTCKYSLKGPLSLSSSELRSLKYIGLPVKDEVVHPWPEHPCEVRGEAPGLQHGLQPTHVSVFLSRHCVHTESYQTQII